jgi:hypothetical protein
VQYYVVTKGRANLLDRLQLRDRATYGLDWMVFYASSAADGIRQWEEFQSGAHLEQDELQNEAAKYRAATRGYAPAWQAEREVVAAEAAGRVRAEQRVLRERQAHLDAARQDLEQIAATASVSSRQRRRVTGATTPKRRATKSPSKRRRR